LVRGYATPARLDSRELADFVGAIDTVVPLYIRGVLSVTPGLFYGF
jgi:hypothetical protein